MRVHPCCQLRLRTNRVLSTAKGDAAVANVDTGADGDEQIKAKDYGIALTLRDAEVAQEDGPRLLVLSNTDRHASYFAKGAAEVATNATHNIRMSMEAAGEGGEGTHGGFRHAADHGPAVLHPHVQGRLGGAGVAA